MEIQLAQFSLSGSQKKRTIKICNKVCNNLTVLILKIVHFTKIVQLKNLKVRLSIKLGFVCLTS